MSGSGTVTAHTEAGIKNIGSVENAEAKVKVHNSQLGKTLPDGKYYRSIQEYLKDVACK